VEIGYTFLLQDADPLATSRLILALLCVIILSSTGLAITVGLSRRIQAIADQRPVRPLADEEKADADDHLDA
jgi:cell division protein FtsL